MQLRFLTESIFVSRNLAESRGVEPHPRKQDRVFKARRRTNPAALLSVFLVRVVGLEPTRLSA